MNFLIFWRSRKKFSSKEIAPDEIFLDSSNLPQFDTYQFEGRLDRPISKKVFLIVAIFFIAVAALFLGKLWTLQIKEGEAYAKRSENNRLRHTPIFANRGIIFDRNGSELAYNAINPSDDDFPLRKYSENLGLSHILGYVKYPTKDSAGFYYQTEFVGKDGAEKIFNDTIEGKNGLKIVETDALGMIQSQNLMTPPENGKNLSLSIDAKLQSELYRILADFVDRMGFKGGAGVIMDVRNGEIIAITSFPGFSSDVMTQGADENVISNYTKDLSFPFLNRAVSGVYTPGSIVKPFMAMAVLSENIIDPKKKIQSTGSISLPNPYFPEKKNVFKDWKAHGWVDLRRAIAVSSNVYFFEVGGGFENQKGLGISNIEKYMRLFGFSEKTGINLPAEENGVVPNPLWKKQNFNNDDWRIGDTYNTAIGQYGFQVTPIQVARAVAAIANGGILYQPTIKLGGDKDDNPKKIPLKEEDFQIVREGMRMAVTEGTVTSLNFPSVKIAAKTGTAELGASRQLVNSWTVGFFPYDNPRYSFAVIMEKGSRANQVSSTFATKQFFEWMMLYTPEYFRDSGPN